MWPRYFLVIHAFLLALTAPGQPPTSPKDIIISLKQLASQGAGSAELDQYWQRLVNEHRIPFTTGDSVLFLYRGNATSIAWTGDFNAWGYDRNFQNKGTRLNGTDIWFLKASFERDARMDYRIVINGNSQILDPVNPYNQWSGVGGGSLNSELRMPDYESDPAQELLQNIPRGQVLSDLLFHSKELEYQITYSVYLPAGANIEKYPVVYVTDGYEYMHPNMGNMITVLDNLIANGKIDPIAAVFIDHREPAHRSNNRRMQELTMNPDYLNFFTNEFIPFIESKYPISGEKKQRAIMGASQGGLNATYFLFAKPEVFGFAGIQSPTFWIKPQIYQLCENPSDPTVVISLTTGTINDATEGSQRMRNILEANSCVYHYREVHDGASWGNWKRLIDDILIDFFSPK